MLINVLFPIHTLQLKLLCKFLCGLGDEFPTLSKRAYEIITFQNTYLCKAGFS